MLSSVMAGLYILGFAFSLGWFWNIDPAPDSPWIGWMAAVLWPVTVPWLIMAILVEHYRWAKAARLKAALDKRANYEPNQIQ